MRKPPTRTNSQITGDVGEIATQLQFTKFGWTADTIKSDYGEDLDCNIFIDTNRTNLHFRCQVKSTRKDGGYIRKLKNGDFSVNIKSAILKTWLTCSFPVLIIVHEENVGKSFWGTPIKQILSEPQKLNNEFTAIHVSRKNCLNPTSKAKIVKEVQSFYDNLLRLDEANIQCEVTPVSMPEYRVIPFLSQDFRKSIDSNLELKIAGTYSELLPSWTTVLRKLDPSPFLPSLQFKSRNADLTEFMKSVKKKLKSFKCPPKGWVTFILSPIRIVSDSNSNNLWLNELTPWMSYCNINGTCENEFEYTFGVPKGFLESRPIRSSSWPLYSVNPKLDLAIQLCGAYEITPVQKSIEEIHFQNIKNQFVLWSCRKDELDLIFEKLSQNDLTIQVVSEPDPTSAIIAITTPMFNPFIGMYQGTLSWEDFEKGDILSKLKSLNLLDSLPGQIFTGKIPQHFSEAIEKFSPGSDPIRLFPAEQYIPGFPIDLNRRLIRVSRFQMISKDRIDRIEESLDAQLTKLKTNSKLEDLYGEFALISSDWSPPIYELFVTWHPEIGMSSQKSISGLVKEISKTFDAILSQAATDDCQFKSSFEILKFAGEIAFEKR